MVAPFSGALTPQITPFTPPSASQVTRGMSPNWLDPLAHEGDVTVEQQLPGGSERLGSAYVVSRGLHLPIFYDANLAPCRPPPRATTFSMPAAPRRRRSPSRTTPAAHQYQYWRGFFVSAQTDVNSWYNSLVLVLRRPMRHGLEFTASYTLSKSFDGAQVPGSFGTFNGTDYPIDPYNRKIEYGH